MSLKQWTVVFMKNNRCWNLVYLHVSPIFWRHKWQSDLLSVWLFPCYLQHLYSLFSLSMSFWLIWEASPKETLLLGMGTIVGWPFLEKAYLFDKQEMSKSWYFCWFHCFDCMIRNATPIKSLSERIWKWDIMINNEVVHTCDTAWRSCSRKEFPGWEWQFYQSCISYL